MKNSVKWILMAAVSVIIFVGIYFAYNNLKNDYESDRFSEHSEAASDVESGAESVAAPDFTVFDKDGNEVRLSDYFGKPIVLNFWASWCYYCKQEMPDFDDAYKKYDDIQFLMVNVTDGGSETLESAQSYIEKEGYSFPVFYDITLQAANTYGAYGLPMSFFIDREGNLVTYASGMMTAENLEKAIALIK